MWGRGRQGERGRSAKASRFEGDEVYRCLRESWLHYLLLFRLACLPLELPGSPKWGKDSWKHTPGYGEITLCYFLSV